MTTATQRAEFVRLCCEVVEDAGAVAVDSNGEPEDWRTYELDSFAGLLSISIAPGMDRSEAGNVYCRFANAKLAKPRTGCNPFSGKWNHLYGSESPEIAASDLRRQLNRVLPHNSLHEQAGICGESIARAQVDSYGHDLSDPPYTGKDGLTHEQARDWFAVHAYRRLNLLWECDLDCCDILKRPGAELAAELLIQSWLIAYRDNPPEYRRRYGKLELMAR